MTIDGIYHQLSQDDWRAFKLAVDEAFDDWTSHFGGWR